MLKEQDLLDSGFRLIKSIDYNAGTDIYEKVYVLSTSEYEKKKLRLIIGDDLSNPEFCYFIKIFPKRGYNFKNGIIIKKSSVPNLWGNIIFEGIVEDITTFNILLKQLEIK